MKWIGAFLFLLSSMAFAQDYQVLRFEANDYRSFTFEEMSGLLGANQHLLPHLKCNGRDENDPFTPPLRKNPLGNSLRIKIPKSDMFYTYQLGRLIDQEGREITPQDPFMVKVKKALDRFEKIRPAADLLRMLEESYFPLTIVRGNNSFNPQIEGGKFWSGIKMAQAIAFLSTLRMSPGGNPLSDIGVGGEILWNPDLEIDSIESDGVRRKLDSDVALAHEMYHAFDSIRGMLDMGMIQGEGYEFETVVEYRAVYFENLVRRELGLKFRKHYSDPSISENAPDLLGPDGEPIFIKSPCL